ncbi:hypothetical protein POM88_012072 [Heracleum sosnowskyi]|uniref:Endonuclease/exonuclease/phosphatase domain-containing protein n=1 Tax=Heracleum sosnowskyi TaxID=360622 RepID=A0AAD8N1W8_9APIA|nr:hypothetical protein POM88_012072 [Heracleum sosnowskyi]
MSTLSWNCHGPGTPWALQFLKESILQKSPDFVFLSEILCKKDRVEKVKNNIGFEGAFIVDTIGRSGGLALLWRNKQEVMVLSYSKHHIDMVIETKGWRKNLMELMKKGVARRVGNGLTVDILHDPWLPCQNDPYIRTFHETLKGNKVVSLMSMDEDRIIIPWPMYILDCKKLTKLIITLSIQDKAKYMKTRQVQ